VKKRGILGIDESNHGHFPGLIVGACSTNPLDSSMEFGLDKKRGRTDIKSLLKEKDFRYLCFTKDYLNDFNYEQMRLIAFTELIYFFDKNLKEINLKEIIIDGELAGSNVKILEKMIPPLSPTIQIILKQMKLTRL